MGTRFSAPAQTYPEAHPASCTMGTGSFPGVRCCRGVTLTPHPLLVLRSKYSRAIPLLSLRAFVAYERAKPTYISLARTEPPKIPSQQHTHSISLPGLRTIEVLTCNLLTFVNEANTVKCKSSSATWGLCHDFTLSRSPISVWVSVYVRCCNC